MALTCSSYPALYGAENELVAELARVPSSEANIER
jgi:hypothetical protein